MGSCAVLGTLMIYLTELIFETGDQAYSNLVLTLLEPSNRESKVFELRGF